MPEFESSMVDAGETQIQVERGGSAPAVLLLHGFPETVAMRREIALVLAGCPWCAPICAATGPAGVPPSDGKHAPYSKRALARDMVAMMARLARLTVHADLAVATAFATADDDGPAGGVEVGLGQLELR
jgi:pimeloyl-ACP methyl ester carboxylesterase